MSKDETNGTAIAGSGGSAGDGYDRPGVGAGESPAAPVAKTHAETVGAMADAVWAGIAALSQVSGVAPDGKRVDGLSVDVAAAIEALGLVAARLIDAAADGGPPEHFQQLTGKLAATTYDMLAKLRAVREAMKPPAIIAPRPRIIIPGGRA